MKTENIDEDITARELANVFIVDINTVMYYLRLLDRLEYVVVE